MPVEEGVHPGEGFLSDAECGSKGGEADMAKAGRWHRMES